MTMLKLQLFGGFELTGAGGPPLPTRKAEALLAYLAVPVGRAQRRDTLAALLWGDRGEVQARHSLAQTLYLIRRTFGARSRDALIVDGRSVALDPSRIEIDVSGFETLAAANTQNSLRQAAALYRGEMLAGFYLAEDIFEEWLLGEQRRLQALALAALERLLRHQVDGPDDAAAIESARRMLALDPLQEPVHRTLMRLYHRAGRKDAAIRQYRICAKILRRELDIEPDAATVTLYREVVSDRFGPSETNKSEARITFLQTIDLDPANAPAYRRVDWVRVQAADRGWDPESEAVPENANPALFSGGYFAKALGTLSALSLWMMPSDQEAAERRSRYYNRTLVVPPSTMWPHGIVTPGGLNLPMLWPV